MHPKGERGPVTGLNLQDVCDGMTTAQLKVREEQQDRLVRSARERVLSARSSLSPTLSMRDISPLSTRTRRDIDETDDARSYAGEADDGGYSEAYPRSGYSTPDIYSDSGSSYSHMTRARTLPDADMLKPEYRIDERPELRSYNSFTGDMPRKRLCMRSRSAVSREFDGIVNGLSRQCCDVLGPKVCHQCALYKRRLMDSHRHERPLTRLQTSERNFADSIILSRTLPDLTLEEIEDKVISGEISRISLRERVYLKRERTVQERSIKNRHKEYVKEKGKTWNGVSSTFFMNIQDLNHRVLVGKLSNNLKGFSDKSKNYWSPIKNAVKQTQELSFTEKLLPMFRSARSTPARPVRSKLQDKYEPPLLPKVCQNVTPSFFAGSSSKYELPDRLPERVVEDQVDDFSAFDASWSRSSSRNQSTASKETEDISPAAPEGVVKVEEVKVAVTSTTDQQCDKEATSTLPTEPEEAKTYPEADLSASSRSADSQLVYASSVTEKAQEASDCRSASDTKSPIADTQLVEPSLASQGVEVVSHYKASSGLTSTTQVVVDPESGASVGKESNGTVQATNEGTTITNASS